MRLNRHFSEIPVRDAHIAGVVRRFVGLLVTAFALTGCGGAATPLTDVEKTMPPAMTADETVMAHVLRAQLALKQDDAEEASRTFSQVVDHLQREDMLQQAAGLALTVADVDSADKAIARMQRLQLPASVILRYQIRLAIQQEDMATAKKLLLQFLDDKTETWRQVGNILVSMENPEQARPLWHAVMQAERLPADDAEPWLFMIEAGREIEVGAAALALADEAVKRFQCARCYLRLAQLTQDAGDDAAARQWLARALRKHPDNVRLRLLYAEQLVHHQAYADAMQMLASHKEPPLSLYQARAAYASQAGDADRLRAISRQLQQQTDLQESDGYYYVLGQLAATLKQPQQALDWFAQVADDDTYYFDTLLRQAQIEHDLGHTDKALTHLQLAQLAFAYSGKKRLQALALEADLHMQRKQFAEAADAYTLALDLDPEQAELLYGRGLAYAESRRLDDAIHDLRALAELAPDDPQVKNALGYTLADADRDLDEARILIEAAHAELPDSVAVIDSMGWVHYRLGDLSTARSFLEKAWDAGTGDAEIGLHLVEVLWQLGEHAQARRIWQQVRTQADRADRHKLKALQTRLGL